MKTAALKTVALGCLLLAAANASAQPRKLPAPTNHVWAACRHPVRVFGRGEAVNLMPLFEWWQHQPLAGKAATNQDLATDANDTRPLVAWHRITGVKAADAGNSWLVNAVIYTSPTIHTNARILLNHPPVAEEQSCYALQTQLAVVGQQIITTQKAYQANTNAVARAQKRVQAYRRSWSKVAPTGVQQYSAIARQRQAEADTALGQLKQLEATRGQIEGQLKIIPVANGRYVIDLFAMAQGTDKKGVFIYDVGVINPGAP